MMFSTIIILNIIRTIINIIIYRHEYDYHDHTDGVATNFDPKEVEKRDNAVILIVLSFLTILWFKYSKPENRQRVITSNIVSLVCILIIVIELLFN